MTGSSNSSSVLANGQALYTNPATLLVDDNQWLFNLSHSLIGGTDIRSSSGTINYSNRDFGTGLMFGTYGIEGFEERIARLAFSRRLGASSFLGVKLNFQQLQITGLGQSSNWDLSIGYWQKTEAGIIISAYLDNPLAMVSDNSMLDGKAQLSLAYIVSEKLTSFSSVTYSDRTKLNWTLGVSYDPYEYLGLVISWYSLTESLNFGADIQLFEKMSLGLGVNTHPTLGNALNVSVDYRLER